MSQSQADSYRYELHGLRGVAIFLVVIYHIWFGRVSGGIDIFLLISSFLLMQTFIRRVERGALDIKEYWAKAFRRLLPPAVLTVLVTFLVSWFVLSPTRRRALIAESVASVLHYQNWQLAFTSADYYADRSLVSPLQHFWSLSLQGQIFLLWPAIIGVCFVLAKRNADATTRRLWGVFGAIFLLSLAWSIIQTSQNQQWAYFSTITRLWEFALGALLALAVPHLERRFGYGPGQATTGSPASVITRGVLGWLGIAAVISVGIVVDVAGLFPGYIALWPTLAASVIIACGATGLWWGVDRLLSQPILQRLGDISYGLYLVHWPILIVMLQVTDRAKLGLRDGAIVLAVSIVLAWLVTKVIDQPIRRSAWLGKKVRRSIAVIVLSLAVGLIPVVAASMILDYRIRTAHANAWRNNPGARELYVSQLPTPEADAPTLPLDGDFIHEAWFNDEPCAGDVEPSDPDVATHCAMSQPGDGETVVLVGDSRAQHYGPLIEQVTAQSGYQLVSLIRHHCAFGPTSAEQSYPDLPVLDHEDAVGGGSGLQIKTWCAQHNQAVMNYLVHELQPAAVVLVTTDMDQTGGGERLIPGVTEMVETLLAHGIDVIGVRGTPRMAFEPSECSIADGAASCVVPASQLYQDVDPSLALQASDADGDDLLLIDPSELLCPDGQCRPIVGNTYVYIDRYHVTGTYVETMAPYYGDVLVDFLKADNE